jgi:hypothetical protein
MRYDASMSPGMSTRIRFLPVGEPIEANQVAWEGANLFVDLPEEHRVPVGSLVEVEAGPMLYLGEVQQWSESTARIMVEHSLDRAKLAAIHDTWV